MSGAAIQQVVRSRPSGRLEQDIQRNIDTRILKPHDCLQSETQLAVTYGIGLYDVRVAIRKLKNAGYLYSRPKSGVFVADAAPRASSKVASRGFHTLDVVHGATCTLTFVISGWTDGNRLMWERICRNVSRIHPRLTVQPVFPANAREYDQRRLSCDVFIAPATDKIICDADDADRAGVDLPERSEIAGLPTEEKYLRAVTQGDKAVGVPLCGTLIIGGLNPIVLSVKAQKSLLKTRSWDAVFGVLAAVDGGRTHFTGINLHSLLTFSVLHYLTHCAGPLADLVTGEIRIRCPEFREALECLAEYRGKAFQTDDPETDTGPESCAAYAGWTYRYARDSRLLEFTPWLLPLGEESAYVEGLNIAGISRHTTYPEESRKFLFYLLSDDVQRELAMIPGEHPVSTNVAPFTGFPDKWRALLEAVKARSNLAYDYRPGYWEFISADYGPLAGQFFHGEIGAAEMIDQVEARAKRFFAQKGSVDRVSVKSRAPVTRRSGQ